MIRRNIKLIKFMCTTIIAILFSTSISAQKIDSIKVRCVKWTIENKVPYRIGYLANEEISILSKYLIYDYKILNSIEKQINKLESMPRHYVMDFRAVVIVYFNHGEKKLLGLSQTGLLNYDNHEYNVNIKLMKLLNLERCECPPYKYFKKVTKKELRQLK